MLAAASPELAMGWVPAGAALLTIRRRTAMPARLLSAPWGMDSGEPSPTCNRVPVRWLLARKRPQAAHAGTGRRRGRRLRYGRGPFNHARIGGRFLGIWCVYGGRASRGGKGASL